MFFYLFFGLIFHFVNYGYLKQIVFNELLLAFLFVALKYGAEFIVWFGLIGGWIVNGLMRTLTYLNLLFLERFNDFGYYFSTLHQLPGFWGVVVLPFVFFYGWKNKLFGVNFLLFGELFYLLGFFEWRIFLSLLLFFLPFFGLLVQKGLLQLVCYKHLNTI